MVKAINKFKVGDLVQLKSGGPVMTIDGMYPTDPGTKADYYTCKWFSGKKVESESFDEDSLIFPEKDKKEE
jgi:uncharacterized protein YodC (DUF2158 family)